MSIGDRLLYGTCEETRERLSSHLDGELRGFWHWRVLRHVGRCERCRAVLLSLARVVEHLRSLGDVEPPALPSTADAVLDRVRREPPERAT